MKEQNKRIFNIILFVRVISTIGNTLFYPVMLIATTLTTNVYLLSSLATLSENVPLVLNPLLVSIVQNNKNKQMLLFTSAAIRGICYLSITLLFLNINTVTIFLAILLNFISDTVGMLSSPIETQCVINSSESGVLEKRFGKLNAFTQVAALVAILIGGGLTEIFPYWIIALINAIIFLLVAFCYLKSASLLQDLLVLVDEDSEKQKGFIKQTSKNVKSIFKNKAVIMVLIIIGSLNVMFAMIPYLKNIIFGASMQQYNMYLFGTMLALSIGMIIGSLISANIKKMTFTHSAIVLVILIIGIMAGYYFSLTIILLGLFFMGGVIGGFLQTKLFPVILQFFSESEVGYLGAVMDSIVRIFSPVFLLVFGVGIGFLHIHTMLIIVTVMLTFLLSSSILYLFNKVK